MFIILIIVVILFLANYFVLLVATDNSYTNDFRYSNVADAVIRINKFLCSEFKKLMEGYDSEETLKKIQWFCIKRIIICFVVFFIMLWFKLK